MPRYLLQVAPNGVGPTWWKSAGQPIEAGVSKVLTYRYATVTESGGFTAGIDWEHAVDSDKDLGDRADAWFDAHEDDPWPWGFRTLVRD